MNFRYNKQHITKKTVQNSNCIVCDDQTSESSLVCEKEDCNSFYIDVILPIEDIVKLLDNNPDNPDKYYHSFISMSLPAQIWLLVHYDLSEMIFWESINLMSSNDLLVSLTSNEDFLNKFYVMLTPKLRDAMKKEIETWVGEEIYENSDIEAIIEKLENLVFLMLEYMASIAKNQVNIDK